MRHSFGVTKLIHYFNLDPKLSTHELKNQIVDCLNDAINHAGRQ